MHSQRYGRASLVYDLIEEFRQQIVDKTVLRIVNRNWISPDDFEEREDMLMINDHARRLLIDKILKKLNSKISFNGKNMAYSDIILYQGRHMADYLTNKNPYEGFYLRW